MKKKALFMVLSGLCALCLLGALSALAEAVDPMSCPSATEPIVLDIQSPSSYQMKEWECLPDGTVYTSSSGYIEYSFEAPKTARYEISLTYMPGKGSGGDIQRRLFLNGTVPCEAADSLMFSRLWNDQNRDYQHQTGNQAFPSQVEQPVFRTVRLSDPIGYVQGPLQFVVQEGENILRLESLQEGMILKALSLEPISVFPDFETYLRQAKELGKTVPDVPAIKIQGEEAALKSSPSFYPINDRTSPLSEPYHPSHIVLNTIGGAAWNDPGEWIAWDVEVPEEGLYRIGLCYKQNALRGMYATRTLLINEEVPFQEAMALRFGHSPSFQYDLLGPEMEKSEGKEPFWFLLKQGTNRITMEVTLGELGDVLQQMDALTVELNGLYRKIIAITGTVPDVHRNYQLFSRIPGLQKTFEELGDKVKAVNDQLTALCGIGNERTAGLTRLITLMDKLVVGEEQIIQNLAAFKECVTSIGKSILDLKDQPLLIDYLYVIGKEAPQVRVKPNFLEGLAHRAKAFAGSFTNDYNVSGVEGREEDMRQIDVWVGRGRDQFEVIRRLINESFTPTHGISVNLKLISPEVLLPSTLTGTGPEVALQITNTAPVNFAMRGAAQDLRAFDDFEEVAKRFHPAALTGLRFLDGCYALPDQMSFPVMFYRKDILSAMGMNPPETWTDLIDLIPEFQKENMTFYLDTKPPQTLGVAMSLGSSKPINTVFLSRLFQTGGDIYHQDGKACLLDTEEANRAFRWWTQFYTQHGFPRDIDFITRFRLGEVPLGIVDLYAYNALSVSAPEIRNQWGIAPVPGTRLADGSVSRAVPCVIGASMIIRNIAEKNDTAKEAWDFLKWWTSEETQTKYAREMESILGPSGRYLVANLDSFESIAWPGDIKENLREMLPNLHGIPEVPGGYITGRYLNNAFLSVITAYENPSDMLFENAHLINEEIAAKRLEFGLDIGEGGETP